MAGWFVVRKTFNIFNNLIRSDWKYKDFEMVFFRYATSGFFPLGILLVMLSPIFVEKKVLAIFTGLKSKVLLCLRSMEEIYVFFPHWQ